MRHVALLLIAAACGYPARPAGPPVADRVFGPRLPPPALIDPAQPGAAYLTSIALQLEPGWGQFLDDCRIRLPGIHPLNRMTLAATAAITIDKQGRVIDVGLAVPSGNADFDRAVRDAIADATVLPVPPVEALSDDDRVHLRWLFARDRRQAGPATAELEHRELPLATTIAKFVASGELARAARRCATAPASAERTAAISSVMAAALREALASLDGSVQRAAVEAIGAARVTALAPDVRLVLAGSSDAELRATAILAAGELGDRAAGETIARQLAADLGERRRLALAETTALVQLGRTDDASAAIAARLPANARVPNPIVLEASAPVPLGDLVARVTGWLAHGDATTRLAACAALAGETGAMALHALARALDDPDASVRASCAAAAAATPAKALAPLAAKLVALQRDRDGAVRANALVAVALVDPAHLAAAADDSRAEVRAAYWRALALRGGAEGAEGVDVHVGLRDVAAEVRLAAVPLASDDALLRQLAAADDAPEVRTAALVALVRRAGRAGLTGPLLDAFGAARPASADRVRIARAWLLAP
ncbi:MAG: TonB family protein [Kofleriaceae bacterium]